MKETRQNFVNLLNARTKKVNGSYKPKIVPPLEKGRKMISQHNETTEIFADHYAKISINLYIKSNLKKFIRREKKTTNHTMNYLQRVN